YMNSGPCAKWIVIVAITCAMAAVSEPALSQQAPRTSERPTTNPAPPPGSRTQYEQVMVYPTEGYFAVFGGYTFGGKYDAAGTGAFNGVSFGNGSLADSAVVGAKAGGFLPASLSWFGVEAELFNTTPNIEQQGAAAGSHMRVTTLAINAVARGEVACRQ